VFTAAVLETGTCSRECLEIRVPILFWTFNWFLFYPFTFRTCMWNKVFSEWWQTWTV